MDFGLVNQVKLDDVLINNSCGFDYVHFGLTQNPMSHLLVGTLEFLKETGVVFREHAQIFNLIFQIGDTLYPHAEGKTAVNRAVDTASVKDIWIDHSTAENFNPSGVFTE